MSLPTYKDIKDLIEKGATVKAQEQIMALREGALELQEENLQLKEEIKALEQKLETKGKIYFKDGLYWLRKDDDSDNPDGPYCPRCYDVNGKLVHIHFFPSMKIRDETFYRSGFICNQCESRYKYTKEHKENND